MTEKKARDKYSTSVGTYTAPNLWSMRGSLRALLRHVAVNSNNVPENKTKQVLYLLCVGCGRPASAS